MDTSTQAISAQLTDIAGQLSSLQEQLTYVTEKQRERDRFFEEMQPILKAVMKTATDELTTYEDKGYFTFGREALRVVDRIVEGYDENDVRALGDNIVRIMDTVRAVTQPRMLAIANDATDAIDKADELEPTGIFGMVRASRDEDVQRGMAVFLAVLRAVGAGVKELEASSATPRPERKALPAPHETPTKQKPRKKAPAKVAEAKAPRPAPATATTAGPVMVDGVAFDAGGYLVDAAQWTEDLARALAASQGVPELTERHWVAIQAARNDFLERGASPNIRRLTTISEVSTKELYQLFPKAPGMTVARVAGIPKPVGCI